MRVGETGGVFLIGAICGVGGDDGLSGTGCDDGWVESWAAGGGWGEGGSAGGESRARGGEGGREEGWGEECRRAHGGGWGARGERSGGEDVGWCREMVVDEEVDDKAGKDDIWISVARK